MKIFSVHTLLLSFLITFNVSAHNDLNVLVFSKTEAFRHSSIPKGIDFLSKMAKTNAWNIHFSENSDDFNDKNLSKYDLLIFLNTSGDLFSETQKDALQNYFASGKGFVGIHAASDTEKKWQWFTEMIGATFKDHPKVQNALLHINKDSQHPAIASLKKEEVFTDEWYNFLRPVGKHVSVLASLDETSYEGKKMNSESHPISWSHIYDGTRVFYTGLGHTDKIYDDPRFYDHIEGAILWSAGELEARPLTKKWSNLLDGGLHKNWDVYIGAPHATVKNLEGVDPNSDGKNATALGLNNDPKNVFGLDEEQVLHITGEIYGALTSKKEYGNYHLKLQFKWGEKIWEPRLKRKKDNGILYHCTGRQGKFWNVWMKSQEFQVQEGDMGDFYSLAGTEILIPSKRAVNGKDFKYVKNGELQKFSSIDRAIPSHCDKDVDHENPEGEWNTLELICYEGTSLHIVNGNVVMALFNSKYKNADGQIVPLHKGKIQIQSEAAEAYYKKIEIKSIREIPSKYQKYTADYIKI
ncbi:MAG: ThuA domain-containing protein [Leeuwenhoekiella sp.]